MAKMILVVDDDADFRDAIITLLEAKGYQTDAAANGEDAFEKAKKGKVDLILLDVMMTEKTEGFNAARALQQDPVTNKIPVILVTGIRKDMNLPFKFEPDTDWLPVKAILEKPVKPEELLNKIAEQLK